MTEQRTLQIIRASSVILAILALLNIPDVNIIRRLENIRIPVLLLPVETVKIEPPEPERPKPLQISAASSSSISSGAPVIAPSEVSAPSSPLEVFEPSQIQPTYGVAEPFFDQRPETPEPSRLEPVASPLPDVITERSNEGVYIPPASLPSAVSQSGRVYQGAGSADLPEVNTSAYTGPSQESIPQNSLPSPGVNRGDVVSTAKVPGVAKGDKYISTAGSSAGPSSNKGIGTEDIVGESEISGLLKWLRGQNASFPEIVRSYLETSSGDLLGVTRYEGWDIFIQFSEDEHQLKIFLTQGGTGILLADSDFKNRSQLFGLGRVTRDNGITAIESTREKPSTERTAEFYRVFQNWMDAKGINMGGRAVR